MRKEAKRSILMQILCCTATIIIFAFSFASICTASDSSEPVTADPQALIGRWEGSAWCPQCIGRGYQRGWSSSYDLEIFAIDLNKKRVISRGFCPDCGRWRQWYRADYPLTVEGGKVIFWTPGNQAGWSGIRFELKGDTISGSATMSDERGIYRYDYSLKKLPEEKRTFDPKELIGQWVWVSGSSWWELTITEVDSQNKTFKGKYMIGRTKQEHELSSARLITEGDRLRIEFKTVNDTLHYQLAFYPNLGEYPPVLWGKLERMDGNVSYPLFRKKEQKE